MSTDQAPTPASPIQQESSAEGPPEQLLLQRGLDLVNAKRFGDAIVVLKQALPLFQHKHAREQEGEALALLGVSHIALGEYAKAIKIQQRRLRIARELSDRQSEADSLGNVGICYRFLGEHEHAVEHLEKALELARILGDSETELITLSNIIAALAELGDAMRIRTFRQQERAVRQKLQKQRRNSLTGQSAAAAVDAAAAAYAPVTIPPANDESVDAKRRSQSTKPAETSVTATSHDRSASVQHMNPAPVASKRPATTVDASRGAVAGTWGTVSSGGGAWKLDTTAAVNSWRETIVKERKILERPRRIPKQTTPATRASSKPARPVQQRISAPVTATTVKPKPAIAKPPPAPTAPSVPNPTPPPAPAHNTNPSSNASTSQTTSTSITSSHASKHHHHHHHTRSHITSTSRTSSSSARRVIAERINTLEKELEMHRAARASVQQEVNRLKQVAAQRLAS